jgi:hypothetical protein
MLIPLQRNRFWGTPIPLWISDDGEEMVCVGSIAELEELSGEMLLLLLLLFFLFCRFLMFVRTLLLFLLLMLLASLFFYACIIGMHRHTLSLSLTHTHSHTYTHTHTFPGVKGITDIHRESIDHLTIPSKQVCLMLEIRQRQTVYLITGQSTRKAKQSNSYSLTLTLTLSLCLILILFLSPGQGCAATCSPSV